MGKIKKILENELIGGTQTTDVYPITSVKAVYDENNERLDNILNRVKQEIILHGSTNLAKDVADLKRQLNGYSLRSITEEAYERLVEIWEVDDNTLYFLEEEVE